MMEPDIPIASALRGIRIDPDRHTVEVILVDADAVPAALRTGAVATIDLQPDHCLVIDDGSQSTDHPTRFRFTGDDSLAPCFGPALVLGIVHGNWTSATLDPDVLGHRIIWEEWDPLGQRYVAAAVPVG